MHPVEIVVRYGYGAVFVIVGLESAGVPLPGETVLVLAAIYAATDHRLAIAGVIAAAAAGAILGDNLGFVLGRALGPRVVTRVAPFLRISERRLKLAVYLFERHGGKVVFFGRFVALLRTWAALLAGMTRMPWPRFLAFNAAGGALWASVFGLLGFAFGEHLEASEGALRWASIAVAIAFAVIALRYVRRNEERLCVEAEEAMPGPLFAPRSPRTGT